MVTQPGSLQATFNSGEASEELWTRSDVKQFYASAALMQNVEPVPQGGFRLLDRSRDLGAGRVFAALAGTFEAGTPGEGEWVLGTLTFAAPVQLAALSFACTASLAASGVLSVEYQAPGGSWLPLTVPKFGLGLQRGRRTAGRPPGAAVAAQAVRLVYDGSAGTVTVTGLALDAYGEASAAGAAVQLVPFTYSLTETYMVVLAGDLLADVFRDGAWVGIAPHRLAATRVRAAVPVQRLETLLLFHDAVPQHRIVRAGDHEWVLSDMPVSEVPNVDLGGTYTKVVEVWQIAVYWPSLTSPVGYNVVVSVDGEDAVGVEMAAGPDYSGFAVSLAAAIGGLATVGPGITVVDSGAVSATQRLYTLTFSGDKNAGSQFVVSARVVNSASGAATAVRKTKGDPGGEPLFSATRGYPATGIFYQDRLLSGGFASKPGAILASPAADYWSGNILIEAATGGILLNLDTDGAEKILRFARARHLVVMTSDAEYYVADRALRRDQPVNVVESSRNGSAEGVPVCSTESNLLFVSRTRSLVYTAAYDDIAQAYVPQPLTLLAKHLLSGIRDAALQRANDRTDAARYYLVRDDGMMAVGLLIQSQEVTAFVRWVTDGQVRAAAVDGANRVWLAVDRQIGGVTRRRVEWLEPGLLLDGAVTRSLDPPAAAVTGLDMHEGASVWALADGFALGPFTVAAGAITLPAPAASVTVGRWTPPRVVTLPLPRDVAPRTVFERPCRVHSVLLKLLDTTSIAIGANGLAPEDVALYRAGQPTDLPQRPVDEWTEISGLAGWSIEGQVEITQSRPGTLRVAAVNIQART